MRVAWQHWLVERTRYVFTLDADCLVRTLVCRAGGLAASRARAGGEGKRTDRERLPKSGAGRASRPWLRRVRREGGTRSASAGGGGGRGTGSAETFDFVGLAWCWFAFETASHGPWLPGEFVRPAALPRAGRQEEEEWGVQRTGGSVSTAPLRGCHVVVGRPHSAGAHQGCAECEDWTAVITSLERGC